MQCITTNGEKAKCFTGRFVFSVSAEEDKIPYYNEYRSPTISLKATGHFVCQFYLLMSCNLDPGCSQAEDFIQVTVIDDEEKDEKNAEVAVMDYYLKDLAFERRWIRKELKFHVNHENIRV